MHTSAEAPVNGLELVDRALTRGECRRSQRHSARRQPTIGSELLEVLDVHLVLIITDRDWTRERIASGQRTTCLQGTGSTESVPHTDTHSHT